MKIFTYAKCSGCRKATKWLTENGIEFEEVPIRDTPPKKTELKKMLAAYDGELKRLFNTSGMDYRSLNMKDKLPGMNEKEAFALLGENGNLVKRPFLLSDKACLVGFKEELWKDALL